MKQEEKSTGNVTADKEQQGKEYSEASQSEDKKAESADASLWE